ncbi:MAG TPA: hypothetical protein VIJ87_21030 [Pyrinomonadaceae bacterium]|jgi:hypothetical protein
MKAVTHNVLVDLELRDAISVVTKALKSRPHIAAFQEFNPDNAMILKGLKDYAVYTASAKGLPVLLKKPYVKKVHKVDSLILAKDFPGGRPTPGTEVFFENRFGTHVAVLNTHPMAHHDKPAYRAAFKVAITHIEAWSREAKTLGYIPMVFMDGNGADHLQGLVSCWDGQPKLPTGPGGETIDGVWTVKKSAVVTTFETLSDHNGVLVKYERF